MPKAMLADEGNGLVNVFPALVIWLVVAVSGPLAAFVASLFVDEKRAAMLGMAATALVAVSGIFSSGSKGEWWIALGAILGAVTACLYLYRKEIRQPR